MNKKILVGTLAIICLGLLLGLARYSYDQKDGENKPSGVTEDSSGIAGTTAAVFSQPRYLVGLAHNVFAGKVLRKLGEEKRPKSTGVDLPQSQYEVRVIYSIKGDLHESVTVSDATLSGESIVIGGMYLLAVRTANKTDDWHYIGANSGAKTLLTGDANLSDEELLGVVLRHPRVYDLLSAYPNEILNNYDIQKGYAANAFSSLSDEQKQSVYAKFAELIPPRQIPKALPSLVMPTTESEHSWSRCGDGKDNDGDGLIDKADPDCVAILHENNDALCHDNIDDDLDGLVDAADPDCAQFYPAKSVPPPPPAPTSTPPAKSVPIVPASSTASST